MTYGDFKNLNRTTNADNVLRDKTFNIAKKNLKFDEYQGEIASIVCKFSDKKLLIEQLKKKLFLIKNYLKNYTKQLSGNMRKENCTHLL